MQVPPYTLDSDYLKDRVDASCYKSVIDAAKLKAKILCGSTKRNVMKTAKKYDNGSYSDIPGLGKHRVSATVSYDCCTEKGTLTVKISDTYDYDENEKWSWSKVGVKKLGSMGTGIIVTAGLNLFYATPFKVTRDVTMKYLY